MYFISNISLLMLKNVYDKISRRYVFVFVGNDDSRVTSAEFIKRDVEMGGGRAIREIGLNFHIFHLFGKIRITYIFHIFHYLGQSKTLQNVMFAAKLTDPWLLRVSPQGSGVGAKNTPFIKCFLLFFILLRVLNSDFISGNVNISVLSSI